jgi:hypothetical protein
MERRQHSWQRGIHHHEGGLVLLDPPDELTLVVELPPALDDEPRVLAQVDAVVLEITQELGGVLVVLNL